MQQLFDRKISIQFPQQGGHKHQKKIIKKMYMVRQIVELELRLPLIVF